MWIIKSQNTSLVVVLLAEGKRKRLEF